MIDSHCLLQQLAFSKSCHLAGIYFPPKPWPVTSVALDMLHQAMRFVSHRHTVKAIEMANKGGTFLRRHHLYCLIKLVAKHKTPWYGPFKLTKSSIINLIGVISLSVCYWPSPTTMDTVSANIVAGGRARFQ
jgi:hypothetical protein